MELWGLEKRNKDLEVEVEVFRGLKGIDFGSLEALDLATQAQQVSFFFFSSRFAVRDSSIQ
jgi:hypothetical protein